jgi:hypothetical protein
MMNAGIEAIAHFTMNTTMLPNGMSMSVTVTRESDGRPPESVVPHSAQKVAPGAFANLQEGQFAIGSLMVQGGCGIA